jgi:uncharacterized protein (DUF342 family)
LPSEKVFRDGSASVFQGRVVVTDPVEKGQPAILEPGPGLKLYIDGIEVTKPTEVTSQQNIQVQLMSEPGQVTVRVEISADGLEAKAMLDVVPETIFHLADSRPQRYLVLRTKLEKKMPSVKPEIIEQALQEKGVFIGIDKSAITSMIAQKTGRPVVVARGKEPIAGQDARIELQFEDQLDKKLPSSEQLKVDWREHRHIPTVVAGDVLAIKHQPVLGQPGLSVTGVPISPRVPIDVELKAGEGADIVDGGLKAIATRSGRPVFVRGRVEVCPLLVAKHGVNLASGNIKFSGDVLIRGNVDETMSVSVGGNIEVIGSCTHANLAAGGQIVVHQNIIGGATLAGGLGVVHMRCRNWWEELANGLEDCAAALTQIEGHPELGQAAAKQGWGRVLSKLLDTKFFYLSARLRDLAAAYREVSGIVTADIDEALALLKKSLNRPGVLQVANVGQVWGLVQQVRRIVNNLADLTEGGLSIQASYVQGARLEASGDIVIHGKGCYQSYLYAGCSVRVNGRPGIVRGGIVQAQKRISVNEAGSSGGSPTRLKVDSGGTIVLEKVYPNVTIQVGGASHKFIDTDQGIVARIDDEGVLVLH